MYNPFSICITNGTFYLCLLRIVLKEKCISSHFYKCAMRILIMQQFGMHAAGVAHKQIAVQNTPQRYENWTRLILIWSCGEQRKLRRLARFVYVLGRLSAAIEPTNYASAYALTWYEHDGSLHDRLCNCINCTRVSYHKEFVKQVPKTTKTSFCIFLLLVLSFRRYTYQSRFVNSASP